MHLDIRLEFLAWFFLALALAAGVVWIRTSTVHATYEYVQQERNLRKLHQDIQQAKVRWLKLTAPKHLEELARNLDLSPPSSGQVLKYR